MDTTSFDILTKTLVAESRTELVSWLSGQTPLKVDIVPAELIQTHVRVCDQILRASLPPTSPGAGPRTHYFHVELQTSGDADMDIRMAQYHTYALRHFSNLEKRRIALSSAVIYIDRKQYTPDPGELLAEDGGGTSLVFRYRVVKLWEHSPSLVLGLQTPGLAPLAPLMNTQDPVETVVQSKQKILGSDPLAVPRRKKAELCGALFVLAGFAIDDRDLLFKLIWEDWMGLERSVTAQWLMERGEQKGLAKGILEARRDDVFAVLESRFGAVEESLQSRIREIGDAEALRELLRQAASAPSLQDFVALLG